MPSRCKIHVLFHDAGGGHRNAAVALKAVCEQQSRPWDVNLIQFQDLTDHLDVLRRFTGIRIQDQYNILLRNGWTWGSVYLLRILQLTIRILHKPLVRLLANYWRQHPADVLVSVIPHFNREIAESWRSVYPGRRFVTIITDLADFPPRFWIEPISEQIVVVGLQRPGDSYLDQFAGPVVLSIGDGQYVGVAIISRSDTLPFAALGSSSSGGALDRHSHRARRYRARWWTRSLRLKKWHQASGNNSEGDKAHGRENKNDSPPAVYSCAL